MIPKNIRKVFPLLEHRASSKNPLVYLDSAATSQKPKTVIDAERDWYECFNANVHRGLYDLAEQATALYEASREKVARFLNARDSREIIFTKGATEGINLVCEAWAKVNLKKGESILLTEMEHHANLVPWQVLAQEKHLKLRFWPIDKEGRLVMQGLKKLFSNVKFLSMTHVSNVLGTINPAQTIIAYAHRRNIPVLLDASQSVPHMPVDVRKLKADFLVFSGHKMLGPTGIGVLYVKRERYSQMQPYQFGGEMIESVTYETSTWNQAPWKFEAGTQALAQAYALGRSIQFLEKINMEHVLKHVSSLTRYAYQELACIPEVTIYGPKLKDRASLISFSVQGIHGHDMATWLSKYGIAVRAGHHCAQPLHTRLGVSATVRVSFHIYNTQQEVDTFITALRDILTLWHRSTAPKS